MIAANTNSARRTGAAAGAVLIAAIFALCFALSGAAAAAEGEALVLLRHQMYTMDASKSPARNIPNVRVEDYAREVADDVNASVLNIYYSLSVPEAGVMVHMRTRGNTTTNDLVRRLRRHENVKSASGNYEFRADETRPDDAYYGELWGMERINAPAAWDVSTGARDVYVAVLDTGIVPDHEDLAGNFEKDRSANFTNEDRDAYFDGSGHGTHVSGTIGALGNNGKGVAGVSWRAGIIAVKVLNDDGIGFGSTVFEGLDHVMDLIDNKGVNIAAVNMSLGGWHPYSPDNSEEYEAHPYYAALKALADRAVIVVAAGNNGLEVGKPRTVDGIENCYVYPASFKNIPNKIVVGAIDEDNSAADFTNWSATEVDVMAPGVGIRSAVNDGNASYIERNGTSMAAPHVAGAVALLKASHPGWNADDLRTVILGASNRAINPTTKQPYREMSKPDDGKPVSEHGLLDVGKAITLLDLADLKVGGETVSGFNPRTLSYNLGSVAGDVNTITISPSAKFPDAANVHPNGPVSLKTGDNAIDVKVTYKGSATSKIYRLSVARGGGDSTSNGGDDKEETGVTGCSAGFGAAAIMIIICGAAAALRKKRG